MTPQPIEDPNAAINEFIGQVAGIHRSIKSLYESHPGIKPQLDQATKALVQAMNQELKGAPRREGGAGLPYA